MRDDHIDALWQLFTTGRTQGLVEQLRAVSERPVVTASKSALCGSPEGSCADLGTTEVGDFSHDAVNDSNFDGGTSCSCGARVACRCGPIVDSE